MSLPSTITLNVGSPAADVVFDDKGVSGNESVYYAPSENGDLAGRIKLRVSHETTQAGIVKSLVQFVKPIADSNGDYSSFIQANAVITRNSSEALTDVDEVMEMLQEVFAITDFRSDIGKAIN